MAHLSHVLTLIVYYLWAVNATGFTLPPPTGKNDVGTIELELVDHSRINPFAGNSSSPGPRSFMIQLFYPAKNAHKYPLAPYMGPGTATFYDLGFGIPNGTMSLIQTNSHAGAPIKSSGDTQLILFSTGYGISRTLYTTLAENLASHGYLVASIDHPYDASVVEFPDGSLIYMDSTVNMDDPDTVLKILDLRVKDTQFTLDLLRSNLTKSIPGVRTRLKIQETGMFGHSLGGATAAELMLTERRISGGLNLDGSIQGEAIEKGLAKPFLLMGVPSHNLDSDPSWASFWAHLTGWRRSLVLADSEHFTYSDLPPVVKLFGLVPDGLASVLGSIDGARASELERAYILAFFNFVLRGKSDSLFDGPSPLYPEISFQS